MTRAALLLALAVGFAPAPTVAESCRRTGAEPATGRSRECPPERRVEPHDPDRVRAGRNPGFIDLGNGTEVRIGGRVRLDYDVRR